MCGLCSTESDELDEPFTPISKERGEEILNELAKRRGITRAQLDEELEKAANEPDEKP